MSRVGCRKNEYRLGHPFSLTLALVFAAAVHQFRAAPSDALRHAAEAAVLAREHSFPLLLGWALTFEGWAEVHAGRIDRTRPQSPSTIQTFRSNIVPKIAR